MKEHPILFKGEMVRAILNCKPGVWPAEPIDHALPFKWQTRRVVKPQPSEAGLQWVETPEGFAAWVDDNLILDEGRHRLCPYGIPCYGLWVRETWRPYEDDEMGTCVQYRSDGSLFKPTGWSAAEGWRMLMAADEAEPRWRPSIHMPRWASRLRLAVMAVRVERVQEISNGDAKAEGCNHTQFDGAGFGVDGYQWKDVFHALWDSINAPRGYSWESNPWVWVVEFMREAV